MKVTGILLAGGQSRRMGRDKALLDWNGEPLAARMLRVLRDCAWEVMIVGDRPERFEGWGAGVVPDERPGLGVLGGILTGLERMAGEIGIVVACDMPFLTSELLSHLAESVGTGDGAMARSANGLEPLCAAYAKRLAPRIREMIAENDLAAHRIVQRGAFRILDGKALSAAGFSEDLLRNLNTPDEFAQARKCHRPFHGK